MMYPISGGFYTYSTRFIDPAWGFAMGWNYVFQWVRKAQLDHERAYQLMILRPSSYHSNSSSLDSQ